MGLAEESLGAENFNLTWKKNAGKSGGTLLAQPEKTLLSGSAISTRPTAENDGEGRQGDSWLFQGRLCIWREREKLEWRTAGRGKMRRVM
ncbi:hypothetical protein VTJ49DRAFT_5872 [Mycothermus thermophilus]|uniref:Uncharacterized protein n=1 Tax=Humicola insolens TaxID=85995 RepID=A0ABR3VLC0_HUMIN